MKKLYKNLIFALFLSLNAVCSYGQLPNFTLTVSATNETCSRNGALSFNVSGVHPDASVIYSIYLLPNITNPYATVSTNSLTGLVAGTYRVIAKQTLGSESNTQTRDITVANLIENLQFNLSGSDVYACAEDAVITITVTSGNPVGYEILAGPVTRPRQASNVFNNLSSGNYLIRVFDSCGNAVTRSYTLITPEYAENGIIILSGSFPDDELPTCNTINMEHSIEVIANYYISFPLTINYIVYPPNTGSPTTVTTVLNGVSGRTTIRGEITLPEVAIPYYETPYRYSVIITDACGNVYRKDNNIVERPFTARLTPIDALCGNKKLYVEAKNYRFPITIEFLNAPAGFNPAAYNPSHPTFSEFPTYGSDTNPVPSGNYDIRVTDACGRIDIDSNSVDNEMSGSVQATGSCGGSGIIRAQSSGDIISGTIISAPAGFAFPTPYPVNGYIQSGILIINNIIIPGQYTIEFTDNCGITYTRNVTVPPAVANTLRVNYLGGCDSGYGSVYIGSTNGSVTLLSVELLSGPSLYPHAFPDDVSENIRGSYFMMSSLPMGSYQVRVKDACETTRTITIQVKEYIGNTTVSIDENCSSFNLQFQHTNNNGTTQNIGYWLQQLNEATGLWEHPNSGIVYPENTIPTPLNSIVLNLNVWNLNLETGGHFRIITVASLYPSLNANSYCVFTIDEFDTGSTPVINGALNFSCDANLSDVLLNVSGEGTYTFRIIEKNNAPFTTPRQNQPLFTDLETGIYVFEITDQCENISAFTHDVTAPFVFTIAASLCDGQNSSISVPDFPYLQYKWFKVGNESTILSTTSNLNFNPLNLNTASGTYSVTVSYPADSNSCLNQTLSYEITPGASPNAGSDNDVILCTMPTSLNLFDHLSGQFDSNGEWSQITPGGSLSSNIWNLTGVQTGVQYYFKYTVNGFCGIQDEAIITFEISEPMIAPLIQQADPICANETINLIIENPDTDYTYSWSGPNGFTSTQPNPSIPNATVAMSGNYTVTASFGNCSSQPVITAIVVKPIPAFHFLDENITICSGQETTLTVVPDNFDGTLATYTWYYETEEIPDIDTAEAQIDEPGIYRVTVNSNGCIFSRTIEVAENTNLFSVGTRARCEDDFYVLSAYSIDNSFNESTATYVWTGPNNFYATTQSMDITGLESGIYTVVVTNENGCSVNASIPVEKNFCKIPKGVSPNGDNDNDTWNLAGLDILKVKIFNRYGTEIYEMDNYVDQWHGQCSDGKILPTATYYYYIIFRNGEEKTGWVYLNREVN